MQPSSGQTSGPNGSNQGYYLLGPQTDFPGTDPNKPTATLRAWDQQINGQRSSMVYELPVATNLAQLPAHALVLRRLACPNLPPQTDQTQPNYNPYVTVDYVDQVPTNDAVQNDSNGMHAAMTQPAQRTSTGRKQPYAADKSQQAAQAPNPALQNQPQTTFFKINTPATNPFDWLVFIDRPLISPIELLQVSGYKPHELTQQFVGPDAQGNVQRFNHRAPWFDPSARIYRLLEFLTAGCPVQWVPSGGRNMGKINVNNVWDVDTLMALCDPTPNNFYTANDISGAGGIFPRMLSQRTPTGSPGPNDRPFRGLAAPYTAAGDTQYPNGVGIDDTLLASDKTDANPNPALRRRLFEQSNLSNNANGNPYIRYELMKKIFNSLTTRSNVFAVWVTVGFFEVVDDSDPTRPPRLGAEINKAEGRHVRHRMFAVVDRSALTIDPTNPAQPGPDPFFLPSQTAVTTAGQATTISVPGVSGNYEGLAWNINAGDKLVVDVGQNQETVTVTAVGSSAPDHGQLHQDPCGRLCDRQCHARQPRSPAILRSPKPDIYSYCPVFQHHRLIEPPGEKLMRIGLLACVGAVVLAGCARKAPPPAVVVPGPATMVRPTETPVGPDGGAGAPAPIYQGRSPAQWAERLDNRDQGVRRQASEALRTLGPAGYPHLAKGMRHPSAEVRLASLQSLPKRELVAHKDEMVHLLIRMLRDPNPSVREHAAIRLAWFDAGARQAVTPLRSLAESDDNASVRQAAANSALCIHQAATGTINRFKD